MEYAILMADIKGSRYQRGSVLIREFRSLVKHINSKQKELLLSPLTITLGDEFQAVAQSVESAIRLIILIEEAVVRYNMSLKLRYVLYVGPIDTAINRKIAYEMLGMGLTHARENLLALKKEQTRFLIKTKKIKLNSQLNNAFLIYQGLVDEWKKRDYPSLKEFLAQKDYKKIAQLMNINLSTSWRKRKSLKINQYFAIKNLIDSLI